ncbi:MAG: DUF664 domain-containing protein [Robiginitalea sp.]|nr:DUF664 domain-containing protein [Robiginitalea sp.]
MKASKRCYFLFTCFLTSTFLHGQYKITPEPGYSPQIGIMVDMLEELKDRITADVQDLNQEQTDYLIDDQANSIGAMVMHLVATESYYQVETLEERQWTEEETALLELAAGMGPESREALKGKPIHYYLDLWDTVRQKTLKGLQKRDDAWFASEIEEGINNHWVWFHVLEHMAAHMGQIALVKKRLPE